MKTFHKEPTTPNRTQKPEPFDIGALTAGFAVIQRRISRIQRPNASYISEYFASEFRNVHF